MTTLENIFGIWVSAWLMGGFAVILLGFYYIWDCKRHNIYDIISKCAPPKKARPEDDYLIVCRTKKYAMELRKRLFKCISGCYPPNGIKVINNYGKFICLYFTRTHTVVRFISEAGYFEASRGFRGWIVEEHQLEEWLEAAETKEE